MRSTTKEVKLRLREHILEYFTAEELRNQVDAIKHASDLNDYVAIRHTVDGGCFLVYTCDIEEFLNSLGINPDNLEYDSDTVHATYAHLIAREGVQLIKGVR